MTLSSERHGYRAPRLTLSEQDIPVSLRTKLWNLMSLGILMTTHQDRYSGRTYAPHFQTLCERLRYNYFYKPIDELSINPLIELKVIKDAVLCFEFPDFYDFLETVVQHYYHEGDDYILKDEVDQFIKSANIVFAEEKAQFRFVGRTISKITSEIEITSVESAIVEENPGALHISAALALFSQRANPDYRNAIKEAISAVEATAKTLTGDSKCDLEKALSILERRTSLHSQMKEAFKNLYRWTSGSHGIRHAMMEEKIITEPEARFMIIACSAFCNLLLSFSSDDDGART